MIVTGFKSGMLNYVLFDTFFERKQNIDTSIWTQF